MLTINPAKQTLANNSIGDRYSSKTRQLEFVLEYFFHQFIARHKKTEHIGCLSDKRSEVSHHQMVRYLNAM